MSQSLIYSIVAHGKVVLAEYSSGDGNFGVYAKQILNNLPTDAEGKKSYPFQGFNFHTMVTSGITYIVVARDTFGVRIPFAFLEDIRVCWLTKYGNRGQSAVSFEMNDEFSRLLAQKMEFYSNDTSADRIAAINNQMELVKSTILDNLERTIERGESIQNLLEKSETLTTTSASFKTKTTVLKKKFCRRNVWCWVAISIIGAAVLYGIMAAICGGATLPSCRINSGPTRAPTYQPTPYPTTAYPTHHPTESPTRQPTRKVTSPPTEAPTYNPLTNSPPTSPPFGNEPTPITASPSEQLTNAPTNAELTAEPTSEIPATSNSPTPPIAPDAPVNQPTLTFPPLNTFAPEEK